MHLVTCKFRALHRAIGHCTTTKRKGAPAPFPWTLVVLSNIEVLDLQRVLLDELAAWFDVITHESREEIIGGSSVVKPNLQERTTGWVHGGFPELLRIHLAESLESGDFHPFLADLAHHGNQQAEIEQRMRFTIAMQDESRRRLVTSDFVRQEHVRPQAELVP